MVCNGWPQHLDRYEPGTLGRAAIAMEDPGSDTGRRRVLGFRVVEKSAHASLEKLAWRSDVLVRPTAPVVAARVLYLISQNGQGPALLTALEAKTGALLFSTSEGIESRVLAALAFANGHLCFSGNDSLLYCFGLPIDI